VIRGGTVVTAGSLSECDIGISGGVISQIGGAPRGRRYLDASGALVLPGGIDMHVHLSSPERAAPSEPCAASELAAGTVACDLAGSSGCGKIAVCVPSPALPDP